MQRRTYLATATGVCLGGCLGTNTPKDTRSGGGTPTGGPASDGTRTLDSGQPVTGDDFSDLSRWTVKNGEAAPDAGRSVDGSQSVRVETPPEKTGTTLLSSYDSPVDLEDVVPAVACSSSAPVSPYLLLADSDDNWMTYRRRVLGGISLQRYNFGIDDVDSGFDPTQVTTVALRVWTAESQTPTIWFDDLHFTPRPDTGKVMIQFDDTNATHYPTAFPILEEYDYPAVLFLNPDRVEAATDSESTSDGVGTLSIDQVQELHDAGWIISNHTDTHVNLMKTDDPEAEIRAGKEWLLQEGFETGARFFAYPYGAYNNRTLELVDQYHSLGFGGGRAVHGYGPNHLHVPREGDPSLKRAKTLLEWTARFRGVTSLAYHRIAGESVETFEKTIRALHEYESAGDVDVILPPHVERFVG